jgi:hypothetical protein
MVAFSKTAKRVIAGAEFGGLQLLANPKEPQVQGILAVCQLGFHLTPFIANASPLIFNRLNVGARVLLQCFWEPTNV